MRLYLSNPGTKTLPPNSPSYPGTRNADSTLVVGTVSNPHEQTVIWTGPASIGEDDIGAADVSYPKWVRYNGTAPTVGQEMGVDAGGTGVDHHCIGFRVFAVNTAGTVALVFPSNPAPPLFKVTSVSGTNIFARRVDSSGALSGATGTFFKL